MKTIAISIKKYQSILINWTILFPTNFKFYLIISLLVTLFSCEKEAEVDIPEIKVKLVVHSFISPQDTVLQVNVSKTAPIFGIRNSYIEDPITDAEVILSDGNTSVLLSFDSLSRNYSADISLLTIETGGKYFLKVTALNQTVEASCVIPNQTTISKIELDTIEIGDTFRRYTKLEFKAFWSDQTPGRNYYRIAGDTEYNRPRYDQDPRSKYQPMFFEKNILKDDEELSGEFVRKAEVYIDETSDIDQEQPQVIKLHGNLLTVDENYYKYHKWKSNNDEDNPFAEPTLVFTNIKGGLGVFGGFNKTTYTLNLD